MTHPLVSRAAARLRRSLGMDELVARIESLERAVRESSPGSGYPRGPLYFGDHTALVATRWGAKMLADTSDAAISPWLVLEGQWEPQVTRWFQETLTPGQIFVDVGANVGYFTLLGARLVGPGGRVIAVEAHPRLAGLLRRNVVINGHYGFVQTHNVAAWSSRTRLSFHVRSGFAGNSSAGSIGEESLARLGDEESLLEVEACPLDDLLQELPKVDVIKVDVEGAEVQVLRGLKRTIDANPQMKIMFEWARAQLESVGDSPQSLIDELEGFGFRFHSLETDSAISAADLLELPYANVVALR